MLETIMNSYALFWVMGAVVAVGAISKLITAIALNRLIKAAGKMGKSTHKLMKLVKAKFEHTYMLSNGVDNIGAFVDKYLYEYKILGVRLHSWRYFGRQILWICGIIGCVGVTISYRQGGMQEVVFRYGVLAVLGIMILFFIRTSTDEEYQLKAVRVYMIDYLENICAPRYQKQKELQIKRMEKTVEEAVAEAGSEVSEDKEAEAEAPVVKEPEVKESEEDKKEEKKVPQEVILREILEEFLA